MSLDLYVYCELLTDDLTPKIVNRLNEYEMDVEIDPDFSFHSSEGFIPFKFQLTNPPLDSLKNKTLKSGFEMYIEDFNLQNEKKHRLPKTNILQKFIGKKQPDTPLFSLEIDTRLENCQKLVIFNWGSADSFELRFALLTSAILTELTNGVCCYPANNIWYDNKNIVSNSYNELTEYEKDLNAKTIKFHEFDDWE